MEVQAINLEEDKKHKPKTKPQISNSEYAKWLTDKYNRDTDELKAKIADLERRLKIEKGNNKILRASANSKRLKYMNDQQEFSHELMRDDTITKYKNEVNNLHKAIARLRQDNSKLINENLKLKGETK